MRVLLLGVLVCLGLTVEGVALKKAMIKTAVNARLDKPLSSFNIPSYLHKVVKRDTCGTPSDLTSSQATEALNKHNTLRKKESAADMITMEYRDDLADRAQEWSDQCLWEHGLGTTCDGEGLGQNMYITSGSHSYPDLDVSDAIQGWYDEKSDYNFDAASCAKNKMCGHYTQVVWAKSYQVGCGATQCSSVYMGDGVTWYNAVIFVCNYAPSGNLQNTRPYTQGSACSQCSNSMGSAGSKCVNNMCTFCSPQSDSSCSCLGTSSCSGHGSYNRNTCQCDCNSDYYGTDCENSCSCADASGYEWACPQWASYCDNPYYSAFMFDTCKKTCGMCSTPAGTCGN